MGKWSKNSVEVAVPFALVADGVEVLLDVDDVGAVLAVPEDMNRS